MNEMMIDLESKDTIPSAVVLSLGVVVWKSEMVGHYAPGMDQPELLLDYEVIERLYRKPSILEQEADGRSTSTATMKWWALQDRDAFDEAFEREEFRISVEELFRDLILLAAAHGVTKFWASPNTFDFPIMDDLARMYGLTVPWSYNNCFDVRTVVNEASYSAKDHVPMKEIAGKPHMPVTDCEYQIDLLTAARVKIGRRMG